jgi:hypothetical protein
MSLFEDTNPKALWNEIKRVTGIKEATDLEEVGEDKAA